MPSAKPMTAGLSFGAPRHVVSPRIVLQSFTWAHQGAALKTAEPSQWENLVCANLTIVGPWFLKALVFAINSRASSKVIGSNLVPATKVSGQFQEKTRGPKDHRSKISQDQNNSCLSTSYNPPSEQHSFFTSFQNQESPFSMPNDWATCGYIALSLQSLNARAAFADRRPILPPSWNARQTYALGHETESLSPLLLLRFSPSDTHRRILNGTSD